MEKFIKYIISIFSITIISLYICDTLYTQVYSSVTPRNKLQYIINTKNEKFDVIFLGSSRVTNHIDTKLFNSLSNKKTLNLGVEGAGLNDNLLQLKLLIANNNKISNLFLQVDTNFEDETPSNISISEAMPFLRNDIIQNHLSDSFENFNYLKYIPFYRYAINDPKIGFREFFFSLIGKKSRINPAIGFTPLEGEFISTKFHSFPKLIANKNNALNEIINICHTNNIKLTPFISPYCSKIESYEYVQLLTTKVPNLINLSKGYNDNLFFNCTHLNSRGAKKFTKSLYQLTINKALK